MIAKPLVSVILPVYNSEEFIEASISSLVNQSYDNLELIILNDGSTDNTLEKINRFNDKRIRLIDDQVNLGYIDRLNQGLLLSNGEYIARMDADDIAMPDRLQLQVEFMEKQPEYAMCGTYIEFIGEEILYQDWIKEHDHDFLSAGLLFGSTFCHPSVMMRKSILIENGWNYQKSYFPCEDYKLWVDISYKYKVANIPVPLLKYRCHSNQVSQLHFSQQSESIKKIQQEQLQRLNIVPTDLELWLNNTIHTGAVPLAADYFLKLKRWFSKLKKANKQYKIYHPEKFKQYIDNCYSVNLHRQSEALSKSSLKERFKFNLKRIINYQSLS